MNRNKQTEPLMAWFNYESEKSQEEQMQDFLLGYPVDINLAIKRLHSAETFEIFTTLFFMREIWMPTSSAFESCRLLLNSEEMAVRGAAAFTIFKMKKRSPVGFIQEEESEDFASQVASDVEEFLAKGSR